MAEALPISGLPVLTTPANEDTIPVVDFSTGITKQMTLQTLGWSYFCRTECVKISITSAEILNMFTVPIQLVAAPGAGLLIEPLSVIYRINFGTIAYATNTTVRVWQDISFPLFSANILGSASSIYYPAANIGYFASGRVYENTAMKISVLTGNPTAGDGTLDVYVYYRIVTL